MNGWKIALRLGLAALIAVAAGVGVPRDGSPPAVADAMHDDQVTGNPKNHNQVLL